MNTRRLISFLLGAWFAGLIVFDFVERRGLRSVDPVVTAVPPPGNRMAQAAGYENTRFFVRHYALEVNRSMQGDWDKVQLAMGVTLFLLMLFWTNVRAVPLGAMLAVIVVTAIQHWGITGRIAWHGRLLDFVPLSVVNPERETLEALLKMRRWSEWGKVVLLAGVALRFLFGHGGRRGRASGKIDPLDHADDAHIDR